MPDRFLRPHDPPTWLDRAAAHHATVILAVWWVVAGLLLVGVALGHVGATDTLARMVSITDAAQGVLLVASGCGLLWSTVTSHARMRIVWDVQQSSWLLGLAAWCMWVVAAASANQLALMTIGWGVCMAVLSAVGFVLAKLAERAAQEDCR